MKEYIEEFRKYIEKSKFSISIITLFVVLAYGLRLISQSYSIDVENYIYNIYTTANWDWSISLSRWGFVLINKIFFLDSLPIFTLNFLNVIIIIIYSVVYNYLFYSNINDKLKDKFVKYQFIFPILFFTSPIFAEQYNFIHQAVAVSIGILIIPISIILIQISEKIKNNYKKALCIGLATMLAVFGFGIYQSIILLYIVSVAATYFIKVISEKNNCWYFLIKHSSIFTVEIVLYIIINKIFCTSSEYLQIAWFKNEMIICIKSIYYFVKDVIKCSGIFYNFGYIAAILLVIIIIIKEIANKKIKFGEVLATLTIIASPFFVIVITGESQLCRTLFNYPFTIGFIFLISMCLINGKFLKTIVIFMGVFLACSQAYTTSNLYYTSDVIYNSDINLANNIVTRIESQDWYESDREYELILVGKVTNSNNNIYVKGEIIGYSFFDFDYENAWGVSQRAAIFINNNGKKFKLPTTPDFNNIKEKIINNPDEYKIWPENDSIKLIDENIIVIRLSEEI